MEKGIFEHFKKKGWIAGYDKEYLLADPKTGEYFGSPRRLETIYRTNMQSAYSSQRYTEMRDNADNRPYWQYSAVMMIAPAQVIQLCTVWFIAMMIHFGRHFTHPTDLIVDVRSLH